VRDVVLPAAVPAGTNVTAIQNTRPQNSAGKRSAVYFAVKQEILAALIDVINVSLLGAMEPAQARTEIRHIAGDLIIARKIAMSSAQQTELIEDLCNDVLGYGPLEPRDDIADIMVNGSDCIYIEVNGKVERTEIRFRDNEQLLNVCQRIVSQVGRRVDESSPICDARLPDGSRVNVIVPPLAVDGPTLTIRKFKKDKLTLAQRADLSASAPALSDELIITMAELSYLQDRRMAYENLGRRTGVEGVRAVVTSLIQSEKYGTPLGHALRVLAQENRDMRMAEAEKKAASLPPKLTVPMILFFLPVLFAVIISPTIIQYIND